MKSFYKIITLSIFSLVIALGVFTSCNKSSKKQLVKDEGQKKVLVYAYDSFTSDWGPGPALKEAFEKQSDYELELISVGDAGEVLSKALLEKKSPRADVLIGLDNHNAQEAENHGILAIYEPKGSEGIARAIRFSNFLKSKTEWLITPYDWGYFALIYDTESHLPAPSSLEDLSQEIYKKKLILMDPRTSTPGLGFVSWTYAVFGEEGYEAFWKALKPSILTMAPGWDSGYGLFTAGEAPLVISYSTSPAYHLEYEDTSRYQALIFDEGHVMQVEGAALVSGAPNPDGGRAFLDFLISKEAQEIIPLTQWMYPVNEEVVLPASFAIAPKAEKNLLVSSEVALEASKRLMEILAD